MGVRPERLRRLLHRMLDIYSPSGKEEEILDFLDHYLQAHGVAAIRQSVDPHRWNLLVLPEAGEAAAALVGHVDTVTAYELDHYGYREQDGLVRGLGAADMKGGCAAMIEAVVSLSEEGLQTPAALALVVGEEEEGDGARKLVKEFHFPWAVIGEPTNLQPCLSHYGYLELQVSTHAKRLHASLADQGENAIEAMLHHLLRLSHYMKAERPEAVYNIRDLSTSHAGFVVPDRCDSWLDIHLPPSAPVGRITMELEELFNEECQSGESGRAGLRFLNIHSGGELPEKGSVVEALKGAFARQSLPWEPTAFRSHSDANVLWAAGTKPILLGPGRLEQAHAPDESVSLEQVRLAAQLYRDFALLL